MIKRSKRKPEEWRDVKGYEGIYQISSHGRVKSLERLDSIGRKVKERIKASRIGTKGYPSINLNKEAAYKFYSVHRLVAEAFIPNPENKPTVDHKYGEKTNNYYEDLRWATYQEQTDWAYGEQELADNLGENHWGTTLTNNQMEEIIRLLQKGNTPTSIARKFDVSRDTIHKINYGKRWNHILPEVPRPIFNFYRKRLPTEDVEEIINKLQNTNETVKEIAEEYNTNRRVIYSINAGRKYTKVLPHIQRPIRSKTKSQRQRSLFRLRQSSPTSSKKSNG